MASRKTNPFRNGTDDPYANADNLKALLLVPAVANQPVNLVTANTKYARSPIKGRIRRILGVVNIACGTASGVVNVKVGANVIGTLTAATTDAAGTKLGVEVGDSNANNQVNAGDVITIESAAGATSTGELALLVLIEADRNNALA